MQKRFFFALFVCLATTIQGQPLHEIMTATFHHLEPDENRSLYFELDNLSFFKDNEYKGELTNGYSLPGLWLQPKLTYQPMSSIRLEAGVHALIFDGANKYPCYAYHDIGRWKGHQYQSGAHLLPFFRAQAELGKVTFVLGNIYGGANHGTMEPLMNPEVNLTQDPEMGFQIITELSRWRLDAWMNWQSYIFEEDTHQEAFTVGFDQRIHLSASDRSLSWYVPIDILVQHRGGEQDTTTMGVQTIVNAGVGLGLRWQTGGRIVRSLEAEAALLGCWQQSGHLWPFDKGMGGSLSLRADIVKDFHASASLFATRDFVSLYGAPFYSTLSQKVSGARVSRLLTPHVGAEWHHSFAENYQLGVKVDAYPLSAGRLTYADGSSSPSSFVNNFSFGIYLRCNPRFLLSALH
ncbi:MAG: hypothetical protein K6C30_07875 [Bacteroidaceae bacterium]|nr:hypothetical protein [Bacteroidaceae bacterium]